MEKVVCFWCNKDLPNEKDRIYCHCGRVVCDDCDDDGSCNEGDYCPSDCGASMYYRITELSNDKEDESSYGDIKHIFDQANKKYIIQSLKFLIEMLENGKWDRINTEPFLKDFQ